MIIDTSFNRAVPIFIQDCCCHQGTPLHDEGTRRFDRLGSLTIMTVATAACLGQNEILGTFCMELQPERSLGVGNDWGCTPPHNSTHDVRKMEGNKEPLLATEEKPKETTLVPAAEEWPANEEAPVDEEVGRLGACVI